MRVRPVVFSLLLVPLAAIANEARGPNRLFQAAPGGVSSVSLLLDAASLANAGKTQPDLLLAAARAAADANPAPSTRSKKTEGGKSAAADKQLVLDPVALLQAAKASATTELAKHITQVMGKGLPASTRAKAYHQTERLAAGATDVFEISFKANEAAQVGITGLGDGDLDLRVFDESWNEICASAGDTSREYCSWVPAATGMFRVRVKNQSAAAQQDYVLVTN